MKDSMINLVGEARQFVCDTLYDFKTCWGVYPNVLIWCGIIGLLLFWI